MPKQPYRPPTARFDTRECRIILKIINLAMENKALTPGLIFVGAVDIDKIKAKLEHRIRSEEKNENREGDRRADQEASSASAVGG